MNYCSNCGSPVIMRVVPNDDRPRFVCDSCQMVHYQNPKLVVGCIPEWEGKILLCRRAIEPRYGCWTLPAGFLENGETVSEGARRETLEEAHAQVHQLVPYALYNLAFVNQVYFMFRAALADRSYRPGAESLETKLFLEREIPWDELAFSVVRRTLSVYYRDLAAGHFQFHMGDILPNEKFVSHFRTEAR